MFCMQLALVPLPAGRLLLDLWSTLFRESPQSKIMCVELFAAQSPGSSGAGRKGVFQLKRKKSKRKYRLVGRDSGSGEFIPVAVARRRKRTATVERIPV